jgi:cardiolipin synthase A/B
VLPFYFLVPAILGIAVLLIVILDAFFEPGLDYRIADPQPLPLDSHEFVRILGVLSDTEAHSDTHVDVLTDGPAFYATELEAIRNARRYICLEAYIFQKGMIGAQFIESLTERARAGVEVRMVIDAIGSMNTWRSTFRDLIAAGGQVRWYRSVRWYNLPRLNNRTHRELLVVDGETGFLGGAGIADQWFLTRGPKSPRWRDTMFRVQGSAVAGMVATFAENWLESSGELLAGPKYFPDCPEREGMAAMVINSTPSNGRGTRARMLFQMLMAASCRSIHITTPYFLPDAGVQRELIRAMRERGVSVKIVVPGMHSDHLLTRRSSRRLYGELLRHGAQIFEYHPSMIHAKIMVIDGLWSVVGSTNFDHRSFGINDEVNLAVLDEALAARIDEDFQQDMAASHRVTFDEWQRRSPLERFNEWVGWILERQE